MSATVSAPDEFCSVAGRSAGDSPAGSASTFDTAVLLHSPGAWGSTAAEDTVDRLYPDPSGRQWLEDAGTRAFAIRPLDDRHDAAERHAVVRVGPSGSIAWHRSLPAGPTTQSRSRDGGNQDSAPDTAHHDTPDHHHAVPRDTAGLDTAQHDTDHHDTDHHDPAPQQRSATSGAAHHARGPLFAVCTNGRRDRCCAVFGRELATALAAEHPADTVEISHLGGHRFAATMLVLPWGYAYGGLDRTAALEIAAAAANGLVHPTGIRGRSDLAPAAQVADAWWRGRIGPASPDAVARFDIRGDLVGADVEGDRRWVRVQRRIGATVTDTACGGKPFTAVSWEVDEVPPPR